MDNLTLSPSMKKTKPSRGIARLLIAVAIFIVFIAITVFSLQVDDKLDPEVEALLKKVELSNDTASDAYLYLLGIHASKDDDPTLVGLSTYESLLISTRAFVDEGKDFEFEAYPEDMKLPIPSGGLFCHAREAECLDMLFQAETEVVVELLESHQLLMERYAYFIQSDDYTTLLRPFIPQHPIPPYEYLSKANRLLELQSIHEAYQGNVELAIKLLLDNIMALRNQMLLQDNLIGRMVFYSYVSSNLDILSVLGQSLDSRISVNVPELTLSEKDFELVIASEVASSYHLFQQLVEGNNTESMAPKPLAKIVMKPNMTINSLLPMYQEAINYSRLSSIDYAKAIQERELISIEESKVRNFMGSVLSSLSFTDLNSYVSRFFDLNAKIVLLNASFNVESFEAKLNNLNSPFYQEGSPAFLSDNEKYICFDGPTSDDSKRRCLRIKK